ncbi:MAG TPA: hypothetical protein PK156_30475 [Polyangium sp.]|nr:hypothetical protein [Polyangium sp.]
MISRKLRLLGAFLLLLGACRREPDPKSGGARLVYSLEVYPDAPADAMNQACEILKRRFEALKIEADVTVRDKELIIDLPGGTAATTEVVQHELAIGRLEFRAVDESPKTDEEKPGTWEVVTTLPNGEQKNVRLKPGGIGPGYVVDAAVKQGDLGVSVEVTLNAAGAALLEKLTRDNLEHPLAIVLDGKVLSMPIVKTPITEGRAVITMGSGDLNKQRAEAEALVRALKAGAIPGRLALDAVYVVPPLR